MTRNIALTGDLSGLTNNDIEYLRQRPWLVEEAARQGVNVTGVRTRMAAALDPNPNPIKSVFELEAEKEQLPRTDTQVFDTRDGETSEHDNPAANTDKTEPYEGLSLQELKDEVSKRNAEIQRQNEEAEAVEGDEDFIPLLEPENAGRKVSYIDLLVADDAAQAAAAG